MLRFKNLLQVVGTEPLTPETFPNPLGLLGRKPLKRTLFIKKKKIFCRCQTKLILHQKVAKKELKCQAGKERKKKRIAVTWFTIKCLVGALHGLMHPGLGPEDWRRRFNKTKISFWLFCSLSILMKWASISALREAEIWVTFERVGRKKENNFFVRKFHSSKRRTKLNRGLRLSHVCSLEKKCHLFSRVKPWSSLAVGDEGCIGPSRKLLCLCSA